ncbi:MAG: RloB family protein [Myxococcota bacterium]
MGSSRRSRDRRPARRAATRDPRRRLLVVCEGEVTEPTYIRGYEKLVRNASVQIKVEGAGGVPLTLVRTAVRLKEEAEGEARRSDDPFAAYDEVWCVFDVDDHPNIPDAKQLAASNGIELAISNPCFELWLILHFRDSPGARHRNELRGIIRGFIPDYDKHFRFEVLAGGVAEAEARARRMEQDARDMGDAIGRNPSSFVHRLNESIRR